MAIPVVNITIEQGTDIENSYSVSNPDGSPLDLTGYSATAKLIKFPGSTTTSSSITSFNVGIVSSTGQVVTSIANTITSQLEPGRYYYDVIVTSVGDAKKTKIVTGMALVRPSASDK
jgi:hypothetical protein